MMHQNYYVRTRGKTSGPFNLEQLRSLHARGHLGSFHEVSPDKKTWAPAATLTEVFQPGSDAPAAAGDLLPIPFTPSTPSLRGPDAPELIVPAAWPPALETPIRHARLRTGLSLILLTAMAFCGALFVMAVVGLVGAAADGTAAVIAAVVVAAVLFVVAQAAEAVALACCVAGAHAGSERGLLIGSLVLAGVLPLVTLTLLIIWFASGAAHADSLAAFAGQALAAGPRVLLIVATLLGSARTLLHLFFWRSVALRRSGGRETRAAVGLIVAHVALSLLALGAFLVLALAAGVDGGRGSGPFLFSLGMLLFTFWLVWQVYRLLLLVRLRSLL